MRSIMRVYIYVCVCVCERERERERSNLWDIAKFITQN